MRVVCVCMCAYVMCITTGPDDPPDEDAIPVCEACRALVVAKKALIV